MLKILSGSVRLLVALWTRWVVIHPPIPIGTELYLLLPTSRQIIDVCFLVRPYSFSLALQGFYIKLPPGRSNWILFSILTKFTIGSIKQVKINGVGPDDSSQLIGSFALGNMATQFEDYITFTGNCWIILEECVNHSLLELSFYKKLISSTNLIIFCLVWPVCNFISFRIYY